MKLFGICWFYTWSLLSMVSFQECVVMPVLLNGDAWLPGCSVARLVAWLAVLM